MKPRPFSDELESWLKSRGDKTLFTLSEVFEEKSFAIIIMLLMFPSALPIPTGGITNFFEIVVMLLSLELIAGRRTIWLPDKWGRRKIGPAITGKAIPFIIRRVRWFERFSRPRYGAVLNHSLSLRVIGLIFLLFALGAFVSPPFAGLDTLPSMGAVIVSLALILDDAVIFALGCLTGAVGVGIILFLYELVVNFFRSLL